MDAGLGALLPCWRRSAVRGLLRRTFLRAFLAVDRLVLLLVWVSVLGAPAFGTDLCPGGGAADVLVVMCRRSPLGVAVVWVRGGDGRLRAGVQRGVFQPPRSQSNGKICVRTFKWI